MLPIYPVIEVKMKRRLGQKNLDGGSPGLEVEHVYLDTDTDMDEWSHVLGLG